MNVRNLLCFAAALFWITASAQEARVRASLETNDVIWVGQKVNVVVELLAPGFFASAAAFDLPDPHGVLILPPIEHPVVSSETIDGTSYTVQRHELSAFAMRGGAQAVPALKVRFAFKRAPLDTNAVAAAVTIAPLPFTVKLPAGTEQLGIVISTKDLKIEETWQPEPGASNVLAGAAFTRIINFRAPNTPAMVFPPFPAGKIEGLGIYPKAPEVLDHSERGSFEGQRRDTITYVCERPGQFTIPAARLIWFDLESKTLRTNNFPAQTLKVIANPALAAATADAASAQASAIASLPTFARRHWLAISTTMLLGMAAAIWGWRWAGPRIIAALSPNHLAPLNPTGLPISIIRRAQSADARTLSGADSST